MLCVKCGFELRDAMNFCPMCGTRVENIIGGLQHKNDISKSQLNEKGIELFESLRKYRNNLAKEENIPAYRTHLSNALLVRVCIYLPSSKKELLSIRGMGNAIYAMHGKSILYIVNKFINENHHVNTVKDSIIQNTDDVFHKSVQRNKESNGNKGICGCGAVSDVITGNITNLEDIIQRYRVVLDNFRKENAEYIDEYKDYQEIIAGEKIFVVNCDILKKILAIKELLAEISFERAAVQNAEQCSDLIQKLLNIFQKFDVVMFFRLLDRFMFTSSEPEKLSKTANKMFRLLCTVDKQIETVYKTFLCSNVSLDVTISKLLVLITEIYDSYMVCTNCISDFCNEDKFNKTKINEDVKQGDENTTNERKTHVIERHGESISEEILNSLKIYDFISADRNASIEYSTSLATYENVKARFIRQFFHDNYAIEINNEQSLGYC